MGEQRWRHTLKGPTLGYVLPVSSAQNIHARELSHYLVGMMVTVEWLEAGSSTIGFAFVPITETYSPPRICTSHPLYQLDSGNQLPSQEFYFLLFVPR